MQTYLSPTVNPRVALNVAVGSYLLNLNGQVNIIRALKDQADRTWDRLVNEENGKHLISDITVSKSKSDAINNYIASLSKFVLSSQGAFTRGFSTMTLMSKNDEYMVLKGFISATPKLDQNKLFAFVMAHMFGWDEALVLLALLKHPTRYAEMRSQLIYVIGRFDLDVGYEAIEGVSGTIGEQIVDGWLKALSEEQKDKVTAYYEVHLKDLVVSMMVNADNDHHFIERLLEIVVTKTAE